MAKPRLVSVGLCSCTLRSSLFMSLELSPKLVSGVSARACRVQVRSFGSLLMNVVVQVGLVLKVSVCACRG